MSNELTLAEVMSVGDNFKSQVTFLEDIMKNVPQTELPVFHYFTKGLYAREMFIPAGTVLTGRIHKTQHICSVTKGVIDIADESGARRLEAGATFISEPGAKRIGLAITDVIFVTYHATEETDVDKLEDELGCISYEAYEDYKRGLTCH